MLENIARNVEQSKARDDERGARIIDDYGEAHVEAATDSFVRQAWEEVDNLKREVNSLLERLENTPQPPASLWESLQPVA